MPKEKQDAGPYRKKYGQNAMENALAAIQNGLSKKAASKLYGIPRTTLIFRLSEKFNKTDHGPPPVLTKQEEEILVDWIICNHKKVFLRRKKDVQASVKQFLAKILFIIICLEMDGSRHF